MDLVKKFSKDVATTFGELEGMIGVQEAVTTALSTDRDRIQKDLHAVETKLEDQCQYSRRNQLLIHGLDEKEGTENTTDSVLGVLKDIGINDISKSDINRSHRLGRKRASAQGHSKKRPIIVSFISYEHKKKVFDSKKKLEGKGTVTVFP